MTRSFAKPAKPRQRYKLYGVLKSGKGVVETKGSYTEAPAESHLCAWGKRRDCAFVIRFYPSKRGWRILDIRQMIEVPQPRFTFYKGQIKGTKYYPNEDAAIMVAMHKLGCVPETG